MTSLIAAWNHRHRNAQSPHGCPLGSVPRYRAAAGVEPDCAVTEASNSIDDTECARAALANSVARSTLKTRRPETKMDLGKEGQSRVRLLRQ